MTDARDAAILIALPFVELYGWSAIALRHGGGPEAELLFPGGAPEMVEYYIGLANRRMVAEAMPDLPSLGLSKRVRRLIAVRFDQARFEKPAIRRALAVLARPGHQALALRCTAATVDSMWHTAGDTSADFSWYTKRAILAAVYSSTLLFWLSRDADEVSTLAFLDRRLAGVANIGRMKARFAKRSSS